LISWIVREYKLTMRLILKSKLKTRIALDEPLAASGTSSTNQPQPTKSSSPVIDNLSQYLGGELPSTQLNPKIASEIDPIISISENQQQPLPTQEIASELCNAIIVLEFQHQPSSPSQTSFDTTASEQVVSEDQTTTTTQFEPLTHQSVSDTSSVSEDQPFLVQPLHFSKPETIIHHDNIDDFSAMFRKPASSRIQPILELVTDPILTLVTDDNATALEVSDSDDEDIPVIIGIDNQANPVTSTSHQITLSPPPILTFNTVLREDCNNIFTDLMEVVDSRNQAIHLENYEDK